MYQYTYIHICYMYTYIDMLRYIYDIHKIKK